MNENILCCVGNSQDFVNKHNKFEKNEIDTWLQLKIIRPFLFL